jgi:hypothetical protein
MRFAIAAAGKSENCVARFGHAEGERRGGGAELATG